MAEKKERKMTTKSDKKLLILYQNFEKDVKIKYSH